MNNPISNKSRYKSKGGLHQNGNFDSFGTNHAVSQTTSQPRSSTFIVAGVLCQ